MAIARYVDHVRELERLLPEVIGERVARALIRVPAARADVGITSLDFVASWTEAMYMTMLGQG